MKEKIVSKDRERLTSGIFIIIAIIKLRIIQDYSENSLFKT